MADAITVREAIRLGVRVVVREGCWEWLGATNNRGYPVMPVGRGSGTTKIRLAHRISYELHTGPIPEGLTIDHLCRNKTCCNPDHLEAVTNRVNFFRGDAIPAQRARQTHCVHGHPFDETNTYWWRGGRGCIACRHRRDAERHARERLTS